MADGPQRTGWGGWGWQEGAREPGITSVSAEAGSRVVLAASHT